jgi:HEXXH motif-containing protein
VNRFEPSAIRARDLRRAMDASLWESVRDLLQELGADRPGPANEPDPLGVSSGPTRLLDYAAYFDLGACLRGQPKATEGIKARAVEHLQHRLTADVPLEPVPAAPRISNYDARHYTPNQLEQISRWWDTEPANRMALTGASEEEFVRSCQAIAVAMRHLSEAAPELHAEVELIVRDIVLAKPDGSQLIEYGGASSFGLWGALTINTETHCDWPQFYRQIVHETGHNLLFAIAREEPLMNADVSVRRRSPLREDPRPIDGIFHAAYVSAREAIALEALLQRHERDGNLAQHEVNAVHEALELSVLAFWDCVETLCDDTDGPTTLGSTVLADCKAFMRENFALEPV